MPEDILNYNDNWNTVSGLMEVFYAYNQQQQDEGKPWSKWPDWELCLTDMKHELHFDDEKDSESLQAQRKHWLAVMQFIYNHDRIEYMNTQLQFKENMETHSRLICSSQKNVGQILVL